MEKELVVGECYSIKRITGKVLKFLLLDYNKAKRSLSMEELNSHGQMTIDNLSDEELKSIERIEKSLIE